MSRLRSAVAVRLRIPFRFAFAHARARRRASDALVLRIETTSGAVGYGETLARPYVGGETTEAAFGALARIARRLRGTSWDAPRGDDDLDGFGERLDAWCARAADEGRISSAVRCAVELALLDALGKENGVGLDRWLPPRRETVRYGLVLPAVAPAAAGAAALLARLAGFRDLKVKLDGGRADLARVRAVRRAAGARVSLRVDANGGLDPDRAERLAPAFAALGVEVFEEPLPRREGLAFWRRLRRAVPVMADESVRDRSELDRLAAAGAIDAVNLRLAKLGGIGPTLALAAACARAGLAVQLGCLVGETAILAAAGRHAAAALPRPRWIEGSYGPLLLRADLVRAGRVGFGRGGVAGRLAGDGLGVDVDDERLARLAVETAGGEEGR